ncbi:MAG: hypothetical protein H6Q30_2079 [Bacteroidetes bacterium]|nr:hypothetical protein [Bacteroidota bacterium]
MESRAAGLLRISLLGLMLLLSATGIRGESRWHRLLDLSGTWRFELGDDPRRAEPGYDDGKWEMIDVPGRWEDQGFPGYDGYAWYRRHFTIGKDDANKVLFVRLGAIDDVDEIYLNGHLIGYYGTFPPNFNTAYGVHRSYRLLARFLNPGGDNVIAVRVYDDQLEGGIVRGDVGVYEDRQALRADYSVEGEWKFTTGDDMKWKDPDFDDRGWRNVIVPSFWEAQGFKGYDGYGWYRTRFRIPESLASERLILLLGKIDDYDEVYLNGERVGRTGSMPGPGKDWRNDQRSYAQLRAYILPPGAVKPDQDNVLAVRVFDGYMQGGIYDGPLGLVQRSRYLQWKDSKKDDRGGFERFFDFFRK